MAPKLLVIDDDALSLRAMKKLLKHLAPGVHVAVALGSKAGLDMLGTFQPDAVLLDSNMPEISGAEFCRRLRRAPETSDVRVFAMSGERAKERELREAGAIAFLLKPIDTDALLSYLGAGSSAGPAA
jgi:CheY-like chemotaxis protein